MDIQLTEHMCLIAGIYSSKILTSIDGVSQLPLSLDAIVPPVAMSSMCFFINLPSSCLHH